MQQRRGTAAQWVSTNSGNGPILAAGEIGYESDTNKFKIGDGTNHWINLDYFIDSDSTVNPQFGSNIKFEGATANAFETTLAVVDPTADRTITLPDATGTVVLADGSGNITVSGDLTVSGTTTTINSTTINATTGLVFEGATADAFETTLTVTDPTADRTLTLPDATGTVALTSDVNARLSKAGGQMTGNIDLNLATKIINMPVPTADTDGASKVYVDTADALKAPLNSPTFTGTVTLPSGTVTSAMIAEGTIVDSDISASAGIAQSKISGLTSDLAAKLDSVTAGTTYQTVVSGVSTTEIGYLDGVTSAIQTQLDNKQVIVAGVSTTEIGYLDGVTSAIQTQIDAKAPLASPTFTGTVTLPSGTVTSAMIADGTIVVGDLADGAVTSAKILDGTIVNADINVSAAIDWTKLGISSTVSSTEIGYVDGVTSAIQTQLDAKLALAGGTMTGALTLSGAPTSGLHAATKTYVDGLAAGINFHQPVVAATTGNLAGTYNNGTSGVGATLTKASNGAIGTIDGATVAAGDRILLRAQTDTTENGIYTITAVGSVSVPWQITRATDADNNPSGELATGDFTFVTGGSTNIAKGFILSTTGTITIGTTNITYSQFNASEAVTAGTNISKVGSTIAVIDAPTFSGLVTASATGVAFSDGTQTKEGVPSQTSIIQKTAEYTLSSLTERDSLIEVSHTGGTAVKVLIPTDATLNYPIGTSIDVLRTNTGAVTIEAVTPGTTTVNATPGLKLRAQWSSVTLFKRAANLWVVMGDLSA